MRRSIAVLALCALVASACLAAGFGRSGANFTAGQTNDSNLFSTGDWTAPTPTLTTPAANARRDDAGRPTFSGAAGTASGDLPTMTVRIYAGAGTGGTQAQALTTTAAAGAWSTAPSIALPDGTYTAQAEQRDAAGNLGKSAAVTFVVDTTAPAPTVTSPTGSVQTPTFTGTAGNAAGDATTVAVKIYDSGGTVVQSPTPTRTGTTWTATVPTLAEGDYTVTASQSDDLGHTGTSTAQSFTVDRTAPAVTLTAPSAGSATNASVPVFSGARGTATGDAAAVTVRLYAGAGTGGTLLQTRAATVAASTWSVASASALADGTYTVQASQTDAAANPGTSTAVTFTVDTVSPSPTVTAPTGYTGATPVLSGTAGNATGDAASVTVQILSGASVVQTLTPTRTGTTWTTTATTLPQGAYTAQVRQSDSAGNAGLSSGVAFTVDTTAPAPAVTAPVTASFTNNATPTLAGTAGTAGGDLNAITVKVYSGASTAGTLLQTRTATASAGAWSVAATALPSNGQYTVQASQTDAAGNTGTSSAITFTYDTVAPAVTLTTPASGASLQNRTPAIAGTAGTATGDVNAITVVIYSGAGTGGSVVQTLNPTAAGGSWNVNAASLTDGVYTARATQSDQAGNVGTTAALTFTVDNVAPSPTVTAPSGYVATGTPTISGTAGNASGDGTSLTVEILSGASVVRTLGATRSGTTWSVATSPSLADGAYTARVTQADAAGNSATSATSAFTVDTAAPVVAISAPVNGTATNATTPAISGTAGNATGDSTAVTVRLYSGSGTGGTLLQTLTPTRSGTTWSTTASALSAGTYTAAATQTDAAGNTSTQVTSIFTVDTAAPSPTVTSPTGYVATSGPTIAGTAGTATGDSSTVKVEVLSGAGVVWSNNAVAVSSGAWTVSASGLSDGAYTARVTQSDWAGNASTSSSVSFTVDTTTPAPTVTTPSTTYVNSATASLAGAAGNAAGDSTTVTVKVYSGGAASGSPIQTLTPTRSAATWSTTPASLSDGTYTVTATQTDAAGHSGTSGAVTFTVDTVAPAPTITAPTGYVTTATPTLSGAAGNATGDNATVSVQILSGATVLQTLTPTRSGAGWNATPAGLADGAYTAKVTQGDAAGNSATSATISFTVDTTTPAPTVTAPVAGSYTNSTTPTLSGAAGTASGDAGTVTVKIYNGSGTGGTVNQTKTPSVSGGAWSVAASTLTDGIYTVTVNQTDAAGHSGTSTAVTFTVDTAAPAAPTVTAPSAWATSLTPTITGTAANGAGDNATVTVEILSGASVVQTLTATRTVTTWSVAVPVALTEGGAYTVRARQGDAAGNTSANSAALGFTVDTIAPAVTLTAPATGLYTNVTTPALSGAAGNAANDSTTVTVKISNSGGTVVQTLTPTRTGAAWSATAATLAQGTYTVQATQSDSAGNVGSSTTSTFTIDTTAPTAANVTTTNVAGGTAGSLDAGDTISFTFSEAMDPASIVGGWTGTASQPVTLNWTNSASNDWFSVTNAAGTAHLATSVSMGANFLKKNWTTTGTLTRTSATTYTITLDATPPNNVAGNGTAAGANIVWTPDTGSKDLAGNAVTAATFTQTGNGIDF